VEGAFVGLLVALQLDVAFVYAERFPAGGADSLSAVKYRVPDALRSDLAGKRVAIVDDVINTGSALRGTFRDLAACGAKAATIGPLVVLGTGHADSPRIMECRSKR